MIFNQLKHPLSLLLLNFVGFAQKEIYASELGAEANTFLMVYNASETLEGSWEVLVGE